jgi:tripartite-type tricarboxylate transporter receptor subunit TctC
MSLALPLFTGVILAISSCLTQAQADELDILKGKVIRGIIGAPAGETSDVVARIYFDFLEKVLPETTIRLQNVEGSGGAKAARELQQAGGDVITVGVINNGAVYGQLLAKGEPSFDLGKLKWVGSLTNVQRIAVIRKAVALPDFDAMRQSERQLIAGASDANSRTSVETLLLNSMTGLHLKVVLGLSSSERQALVLAGDIDVVLGNPFELREQLDAGEIVAFLRFGKNGYPASLSDVPTLGDVVLADAPPVLVSFIETMNETGQMIAAAPLTDQAVVDALRVAFDRVVSDPGLRDDMSKRNIQLATTGGARLAELLEDVFAPSAELKEILGAYLDCGMRMSDEGAAGCN